MDETELKQNNDFLAQISPMILGEDARLEIAEPSKLVRLKKNARFFKKETYAQLVNNLRRDQRLSSTPLCRILEDGRREILSGNHRVDAAEQAEIPYIMVITITAALENSEKIAIQLSHNAIEGQDDHGILADLWGQIEDMDKRLYAGLSSDRLQELEKVKLTTFATPQVYTKTVAFTFTDSEMENFEHTLAELEALPAAERYLADLAHFSEFFSLLKRVKKTEGIKNGSLAMLRMIEIVKEALDEKEKETV